MTCRRACSSAVIAAGILATLVDDSNAGALPTGHPDAAKISLTRFGFVFARHASSWFLPRRIGIAIALEWCYSVRLIDAGEAWQAG